MAATLTGVDAKLKYVEGSIANFRQAAGDWVQDSPQNQLLPGVVNRQANTITFRAVPLRPPLELAVAAGSIFRTLRTVLDNLVWQLVLAAGNDPGRLNAIPVYDKLFEFDKRAAQRELQGVSAECIRTIRALQPTAQNDGMSALQELTTLTSTAYSMSSAFPLRKEPKRT